MIFNAARIKSRGILFLILRRSVAEQLFFSDGISLFNAFVVGVAFDDEYLILDYLFDDTDLIGLSGIAVAFPVKKYYIAGTRNV